LITSPQHDEIKEEMVKRKVGVVKNYYSVIQSVSDDKEGKSVIVRKNNQINKCKKDKDKIYLILRTSLLRVLLVWESPHVNIRYKFLVAHILKRQRT
jgi:hypothetical protein